MRGVMASTSDELIQAATEGDLSRCRRLVRSGARIEASDALGATGLHWTSQYGHVDVVRFLLASGANVNSRTAHGNTPSHLACMNGHLAVVQRLYDYGADFQIENNRGQSALDVAESMKRADVVAFIRGVLSGECVVRLVTLDQHLSLVVSSVCHFEL